MALENGFKLEPVASKNNPFHAHIMLEQLKVPYDESWEKVEEVMSSGAKRMLDNLTDDFVYVGIEDIVNNNIPIPDICINCL